MYKIFTDAQPITGLEIIFFYKKSTIFL